VFYNFVNSWKGQHLRISNQLLLLLILLLTNNCILSQVRPEVKDTTQKKITIKDSSKIRNIRPDNLSKQFREPFLKNNNSALPGTFQQSLEFSLMKNFESWNKGFINKKFFEEGGGITDYRLLNQQKADNFHYLHTTLKKESPELMFIRKYLGISKDAAAFILLIIHLIKY
jgi:hypothetical protein